MTQSHDAQARVRSTGGSNDHRCALPALSRDPDADRRFLRDVLGFRGVDAGGGWLIFALPPAELAVHPADATFVQRHAERDLLGAILYLMCDDLASAIATLRARGAAVGDVGRASPAGWPDREVAWALARAHWGKGFATEAARAALAHAFGPLAWPRAISLIDPDNHRSIRLAERLGERYERTVEVRGRPVSLYAIAREAWVAGSDA
jgi:RimJ/RimL family protein N-acetyltransferase